jgi:hypothetical protein
MPARWAGSRTCGDVCCFWFGSGGQQVSRLSRGTPSRRISLRARAMRVALVSSSALVSTVGIWRSGTDRPRFWKKLRAQSPEAQADLEGIVVLVRRASRCSLVVQRRIEVMFSRRMVRAANAITLSCKAARRPCLTAARWLPRLTLASEGAMCSHRDAERFCSAHASGSAALSACEGS